MCVALTYVSLGDPATITGSTRPVPGQLKRLGELLYIRRKWNMVGNADICVRGSELRSAQLWVAADGSGVQLRVVVCRRDGQKVYAAPAIGQQG